MSRKFEETVVWQSVLLTIWRQWTERNTSVESCNSWRKRCKWHCLFQMPFIPWHLQLLSPGTCWTWHHSICRWLILLSRSIPLEDYRVKLVCTIPKMSHSKEMFISGRKVLNAICTSSLQGLVQCELFSRFIHLVNHGACLVLVNISMMVKCWTAAAPLVGKSWTFSKKWKPVEHSWIKTKQMVNRVYLSSAVSGYSPFKGGSKEFSYF